MSDELVNFEVGQNAPDFEAELTDGTTIRLSEILEGGEKVILYFLAQKLLDKLVHRSHHKILRLLISVLKCGLYHVFLQLLNL